MLPTFNLNSNQHLSVLFFGGSLKVEEVVNDGLYKNGKIKTKKVKVDVKFPGLGLKPVKGSASKAEGFYSVNEENLLKIDHPIAKAILEMRGLEKQISTYYTSIQELTYSIDECVHQNYQHVATATGRLSCKSPNAQNQPSAEESNRAKEHFISRYQNGLIVSADYSQLEIRIQAQMSQDEAFIEDINRGTDFHIKRLAMKEGKDYEVVYSAFISGCPVTKKARSNIKGFSFARAYGAGSKKISEQTGLTIEEVETLIQNEALAYPRLALWQEHNKTQVEQQGFYTDPWGCRYAFTRYPPRFQWQNQATYSPTEIMNYMTQGFATGVIVLAMIGYFWRQKAIHNRDKYLMINTVHDSLMLDCRRTYLRQATKDLTILEDVGKISLRDFNYKFTVPIKIDIETGKDWYSLTKYEENNTYA